MCDMHKSCRLVGRSAAWWEGLAANWRDANATVPQSKSHSHFGFILPHTDAPLGLIGMFGTMHRIDTPAKRKLCREKDSFIYSRITRILSFFPHWRTHSANVTVRMSVHNSSTREEIVCELFSMLPTPIQYVIFCFHVIWCRDRALGATQFHSNV